MNLSKFHHNPPPSSFNIYNTTLLSTPHFLSLPNRRLSSTPLFVSTLSVCLSKRKFKLRHVVVSKTKVSIWSNEKEKEKEEENSYDDSMEFEDLAQEGEVYQKTLRLVECSMFAAVSGLAYFLSNSLAIENYFGCFFALPIVISSMRWGIAAGRKTMVATALLLFVISGPLKALTYMLMHGLLGFTMGSLWRLRTSWGLSIILCSSVRAMGAVGYVLISSFLIRENILSVITISIHGYVTYFLTSLGYGTPSMNLIYALFGTLLLLNCGFFVFLLHLLYAVFFTRLGQKSSLRLPRWLEQAI